MLLLTLWDFITVYHKTGYRIILMCMLLASIDATRPACICTSAFLRPQVQSVRRLPGARRSQDADLSAQYAPGVFSLIPPDCDLSTTTTTVKGNHVS